MLTNEKGQGGRSIPHGGKEGKRGRGKGERVGEGEGEAEKRRESWRKRAAVAAVTALSVGCAGCQGLAVVPSHPPSKHG